MKKLLSLMMELTLPLSLAACGGGGASAPAQDGAGTVKQTAETELVPTTFGDITIDRRYNH